MDIQLQKPYVVKEIEKHYDVVTNIGFTGELEGNILYSFTENVAKDIVNNMMDGIMKIDEIDDMAISAIGELGNMVSGSIGTNLEKYGYNIIVTPPSVFTGKIVKVNSKGVIIEFPVYVSGDNEMDLYFIYREIYKNS
ncbi:CheC domain protein [Petrotoga mobilis SJ95]|jgi:chemotaxis protein CheX|uniref:CheC domain protein n=1 Tax=Petrotoga mobilis (strain DSM 10674 / SJ95) TaxID=403833 RepID=A9BGU0_PETMO|nr:CheC domain protein [Petrotoga mobilis SJ95]KUK80812.1 MAG: CheC domain protein [Petrotoga mobilis]